MGGVKHSQVVGEHFAAQVFEAYCCLSQCEAFQIQATAYNAGVVREGGQQTVRLTGLHIADIPKTEAVRVPTRRLVYDEVLTIDRWNIINKAPAFF